MFDKLPVDAEINNDSNSLFPRYSDIFLDHVFPSKTTVMTFEFPS